MAYSQLTGWRWGWSGRRVRVVLPSCAVTKNHNWFPSAAYAGFKYLQIWIVTLKQNNHPAGNTHVLIVADYFTRWTEAYAIPNQEATILLLRNLLMTFFRFSPPEQFHSDEGRNFESEVIAGICKLLGVVKPRTTPYHPQSDGLVERYNRPNWHFFI